MGTRDERVADLFLVDLGPDDPSEEGQARRVGSDIRAFLGGQVKSLSSGALPTPVEPDVILYSDDGVTFQQVCPLSSRTGFMVNDSGELVYKG